MVAAQAKRSVPTGSARKARAAVRPVALRQRSRALWPLSYVPNVSDARNDKDRRATAGPGRSPCSLGPDFTRRKQSCSPFTLYPNAPAWEPPRPNYPYRQSGTDYSDMPCRCIHGDRDSGSRLPHHGPHRRLALQIGSCHGRGIPLAGADAAQGPLLAVRDVPRATPGGAPCAPAESARIPTSRRV